MPPKKELMSAVIYSYPHFVYSWPVIVFGFLLAAMQSLGVIGEAIAAWTYIVILCLVLLTMGVDLGRNASIFCLVLFGGGWVGILWLEQAKNVTLFSKLGAMISGLNPQISSHAMIAASIILGIMYLLMFVLAFVNDRWRITHNEIEHRALGHKEDATGRGAKRVLATYPDVLEMVICLSGTIEVYSANGSQKLVTIKNVPFLPFRMKKISRILEMSAINGYDTFDEEAEEDQPAN